ncbi:phenylalanine--tRNA ligase subunit alpha [Candidatus Kaiserbacteria bacterium]|nr:phenylalanine--tRNA ligase subunit alpha [Candidatus Kaiserbacteria bacterium]
MPERGHIHPISSLIREANRIFFDMGFTFAEGPLLEDEWHNFDALNVPQDHPARDMQDTFFIKPHIASQQGPTLLSSARSDLAVTEVLRTHTSPVQIRYMEEQIKKGIQPPYRIIVPGKVFRNEATDMTHEAEFFQIEGLVVGEGISLAHLKGTLEAFFAGIFRDASVEIRFRPSFFPFTEPSVEVDMRLVGEHVPEKLRNRWIEMMGAGLVHPNVLKNAGVDPHTYSGFAFGMGLDRLALLRWGIDDIRHMHSADLRFVNQF